MEHGQEVLTPSERMAAACTRLGTSAVLDGAFPAGRYLVSARDPVGLDGALCWHLPARPDSSEDAHQRGGGDDDARADRGPQERAHDHREGEASPRAVLLALAALGTRPCMKSEISR